MRAGRMLIFARVSGSRSRDDVIRTTRVDEAMHARVDVHGAVYVGFLVYNFICPLNLHVCMYVCITSVSRAITTLGLSLRPVRLC